MPSALLKLPGAALADAADLGATVRRLRAEAALTLKELALRSGIAVSTLSKIENGHLSPTYEKIVGLANGLGIDVAELFGRGDDTPPSGRRSVCRSGEGVAHTTDQYTYELLCTDVRRKQFVPLLATVKAHSVQAFPVLLKHQGEEFIYVLQGEVTLHTEFYSPVKLKPGDSVYFDSSMGHACVSAGPVNAKVLWVCSKNTPVPVSEIE